jgi:3-hydroxybutyrate dehydrogenase
MTSPAVTALITGSTSGIGLGIAERFAQAGFSLLLHGLDPRGPELARDLAERWRVATHFSDADLSVAANCQLLVQQAERDLGRIDVLVNNAGIQHVAPIDDFPDDRWNAVLAVNLSAPFFLCRAAWPGMKARGFGRILNIASVHAVRASAFKSAYVAAKHGLVGLTKTLALEGAACGITANALCPGYVRTPLVDGQVRDQAKAHSLSEQEIVENVMLRRQAVRDFIPIPTIAELAYLLTRREAATLTGASWLLDGGWTAQ